MPEISEPPNDREEGLAKNFADPALEGILLDASGPGNPAATLNEAAEAIHELLGEIPVPDMVAEQAAVAEVEPEEALDPIALLGAQPMAAPEIYDAIHSNSVSVQEMDAALDSIGVNARWEMAEKLFELVICDRPFNDMVEAILIAVVHGLGAEAGSILELDTERNEFFFRAAVGGGDSQQLKAFRVPANKGIVGHVAESRQSVLLQDLNTDEMELRAVSAGTGFETHTCIASPLILANQMYGVVELFNKNSGGSFTFADVTLLEETIRMAVKILEVRFLTAELARRAR